MRVRASLLVVKKFFFALFFVFSHKRLFHFDTFYVYRNVLFNWTPNSPAGVGLEYLIVVLSYFDFFFLPPAFFFQVLAAAFIALL